MLVLVKVVFFCVGSQMCYLSRNSPPLYNETKMIALALYSGGILAIGVLTPALFAPAVFDHRGARKFLGKQQLFCGRSKQVCC